ncbi:3-keto-disaccharide hydrolase [Chitinophaga silvisoli]|uniref:DUF1080 domain-containing protein n=1 Tax=Chitinophaga silvisoli TaxID=2291814 RepID=A0A3E1P316_9BACT|nr:DUF1080 domain-containing protein [Chitinophaga silvisoli]RFM34603.1 DUF1080 domain-containing protein [Chitinophaga silvisoli]
MKLLIPVLVLSLSSAAVFAQQPNTLTAKEQKDGWKLLFDGKTTNGWHSYLKESATDRWKVQDGAFVLDTAVKKGGGDLVTNDEFENYDFTYEWKISEGGNSGLIFSVHEDPKYGATYLTGAEMQVLDDARHPDGKYPKHNSGDLYDLKKATKNAAKPVGEWNKARILKKDGHLTFWLNGTKTIETTVGSDEWKELLANSKFKTWEGFMKFSKGHIALQDHGNVVSYRSIKIKTL